MLLSRARKLRLRRQLKMHRHQVQDLGTDADKHFFQRLDRLADVRRFTVAWVALLVILIGCSGMQLHSLSKYYQTLAPAAGGMYNEGVVGSFTNANPIYASNIADRTVSRLVFGSLLTYDDHNDLAGDLAESWTMNTAGDTYVVKLRPNLCWHDGQPLNADDVVFTYKTIQNPDAQSPLNPSWRGVKVEAIDARTVKFTLPNSLAAFPHSLTNGILPEHILKGVNPADLRTSDFNTAKPIGSGPFKWQQLTIVHDTPDSRESEVRLSAFEQYHSGRPNLDSFNVHVFSDSEHMVNSYKAHELQAMAGLLTLPADIPDSEYIAHHFPQTAAVMTFFKSSAGVLAQKPVRQALVRATDTKEVRKQLSYGAQSVNEPILKKQLAYDPQFAQLSYDPAAAAKLLDDAGWKLPATGGIREKDKQKLTFTLFAEKNEETEKITKKLQQQWRAVGVDAQVELQQGSDFQVTLSQHSYDALLRGVSIGSDPDVFAYWHSSQIDVLSGGHLNFSEYKSDTADIALEQARTRTDPKLRAAKYQPFLKAWQVDAPALGLYQPEFLYVTRQPVSGLAAHEINSSSDRFSDVHEWKIRRVKTTVD